jgi:hypothetical protein
VAVVTAVVVEVGLRSLRIPLLAALLGVPLATDASDVAPAVISGFDFGLDRPRVRAALLVVRHWPFGGAGKCLRRSLIVGSLVRHRRPVLRIGVSRASGGFDAHAWIVIDGISLDASASLYRPLMAAA